MQIIRNSIDTQQGPADWFTGDVYIDAIAAPAGSVVFEPGENHWHGAAPNRFMVHIAMQQHDAAGSPVTWGEHVTDEQHMAAHGIDAAPAA
jgi:hypothetical protein